MTVLMKIFVLSTVLVSSAFANSINLRCDLNSPVVIQDDFGRNVSFRNAELDFFNVDSERFNNGSLTIQDRFGGGFTVFNRLYTETIRCRSKHTCVSTDFSSFRGLSIEIPNKAFTGEDDFFTTRVRVNNRRTHFARCRVY